MDYKMRKFIRNLYSILYIMLMYLNNYLILFLEVLAGLLYSVEIPNGNIFESGHFKKKFLIVINENY
jgi:hypothetical protein